tara:strand:- start:1854 stop:2531 length:678 start_codon:yes stop_codon:yes gene_type:complete
MSNGYDDGRQQNNYGNLIIESGKDDSVGDVGGGEAFSLKGTNKQGNRFILAHHDGGITRTETEQTLQVDCGAKKNTDGTALQVTAHTGKVAINSEKSHILLKASKTITLEANDIILKGTNLIQIGGPSSSDTREIKIMAQAVPVTGPGGTTDLLKHLKINSFLVASTGPLSLVSSLAEGIGGSFSDDLGALAGSKIGAGIGGAIGGPVGTAIGSKIGSQVGSEIV